MPVRLTSDQWQALVRQQEQSSLSIAAFCRKKNLSLSSFHRWRRTLRHKRQQPGFLEIQPPGAGEDLQATWFLEVDLPGGGGLRLRFEP